GINNYGHVVGSSTQPNDDVVRVAYLYDGQKMQNLCTLTECGRHGWTLLRSAVAINDHGDIAGWGDINGKIHAFLITWNDEAIDEICSDGIDNDEDGLTDCQDSTDCGQAPFCYQPEGMAYELIDLGTLGSDYSVGESINNLTQVTGSSVVVDEYITTHAFAYDDGMLDLGLLSGDNYDYDSSYGFGINDSGQITGFSGSMGLWAPLYVKAFLYDDGTMHDLHALLDAPCNLASRGYDINDSGQVTGYCATYIEPMWETQDGHAFLYDGNRMHDLGTLGGENSYGYGINNQAHVTGMSQIADNCVHAFLYDGNSMQDLGTLGGNRSEGHAINDESHVTGFSETTDGTKRAFLYAGNSMHDLGTLGGPSSEGRGINELGQIVGDSSLASGEKTAFLYHDNRMLYLCRLTDCIAEGWTNLASASDINDRGDITGYGYINGETHAFMAISLSDLLPPDPEICDDAIDNDEDGLIDCADTDDCNEDPFCEEPPLETEICDDGIDNDGDGLIDCLDSRDCRFDAACRTRGGGKKR
ncbi:MAG: hypothetical protein QNJ78_08710, partial [Gammaproteobacteria bacterium]|nr:hypothetical protein [Gammaproteobacteria bacterium]